MGMAYARLGDVCDHGAIIITASNDCTTDGIPVARIGDLVSCPIPGHGINPIISVLPLETFSDNKARATIQSITTCGAKIITGSPTCSAGP